MMEAAVLSVTFVPICHSTGC